MSLTPSQLRRAVIIVALVSLAGLFLAPPIAQPLSYHDFADQRAMFGIPHFWNVFSNLPFLIVGLVALLKISKRPRLKQKTCWLVFSVGVALVAIGSSYYHWAPGNATLVWDRMPMTLGFVAAFVAIGSEALGARLEKLLWPMVLVGISSVCVWWATDDLRFYAWVQFFPLLALLLLLFFAKNRIVGSSYVWWALAYYIAAKVFENWDRAICDALNGVMSGHPIKHVLAAMGCWELVKRFRLTGLDGD